MSLLSEGQPNYTLRADSVFGYDHDDWLHTPVLPREVVLGLTYEQIDETLKYFCEYSFFFFFLTFTEEVGQRDVGSLLSGARVGATLSLPQVAL